MENGKIKIETTAIIGPEDFCITKKDGVSMTGREVKGYLLDKTTYPLPEDNSYYLTGHELK